MVMKVLPACFFLCHIFVVPAQRLEDVVKLRNFTRGLWALMWVLELNPCPLEEQPVPLITKS